MKEQKERRICYDCGCEVTGYFNQTWIDLPKVKGGIEDAGVCSSCSSKREEKEKQWVRDNPPSPALLAYLDARALIWKTYNETLSRAVKVREEALKQLGKYWPRE